MGGADVINIGNLNPGNGLAQQIDGQVDNIQAPLTVAGNGSDILNVDDGGGPGGNGNLTSTTLTGLGMGGQGSITYSGLATLNLIVGGGSANFTIQSDNPGTVTNLNVISGNDIINVRSTSGLATYILPRRATMSSTSGLWHLHRPVRLSLAFKGLSSSLATAAIR